MRFGPVLLLNLVHFCTSTQNLARATGKLQVQVALVIHTPLNTFYLEEENFVNVDVLRYGHSVILIVNMFCLNRLLIVNNVSTLSKYRAWARWSWTCRFNFAVMVTHGMCKHVTISFTSPFRPYFWSWSRVCNMIDDTTRFHSSSWLSSLLASLLASLSRIERINFI